MYSSSEVSGLTSICLNGFRGRISEHCFVDMCVFPLLLLHAANAQSSLSSCARHGHEVEQASFTPSLLMSGGLMHKATIFYQCLTSLLAPMWDDDYSVVRCCLSFSLLHLPIHCIIHGAHSTISHYVKTNSIVDLAQVSFLRTAHIYLGRGRLEHAFHQAWLYL